ncbi:hypothetical protein L2E82_32025 [Cichorium intybus]|uniref:Uncharacterized protein n=1 Tax=Cichorium intybus TaxID=13427 RepID=A0ACB9BHJ1_CICIN|nr:hypothetical protein L2E82_32025 [Cichorium intybus]
MGRGNTVEVNERKEEQVSVHVAEEGEMIHIKKTIQIMRDSKYDDEVIMDALGLTKAEMDAILCIAEVPVEIDLSMNFGVASQETIQEAVNEEDNGEEGVEETQIGVLKSERDPS